ncbi:MAG: class I SAM-dependent methyltransferase [Candidatus Scalindua sp.]
MYEKDCNYTESCVASWSTDWLPSQYSELADIEKLVPRKGRLLDVGCGGGAFVYSARERNWQAFGIDLSKEGIHHAREFWKLDESVVMCGNINSLNPSFQFDVITTFHVLEHLYQPCAFLDKLHELMAIDGLLVVAAPNFGSIDVSTNPEIRQAVLGFPYHVIHFTPKSLTSLLEKNGFKVVKRKYFSSEWLVDRLRSLIKPITYRKKSLLGNKSDQSRESSQVLSSNRQRSLKTRILGFLGMLSPGSYMVFYARKKY